MSCLRTTLGLGSKRGGRANVANEVGDSVRRDQRKRMYWSMARLNLTSRPWRGKAFFAPLAGGVHTGAPARYLACVGRWPQGMAMSEQEQAPIEASPGVAAITSDTEPAAAPSTAAKVAKGCGCITASLLFAVAVGFAAGNDSGAWGAAGAGTVILVVVVATSGSNGFWGLRG